jgi:hypothetical protein
MHPTRRYDTMLAGAELRLTVQRELLRRLQTLQNTPQREIALERTAKRVEKTEHEILRLSALRLKAIQQADRMRIKATQTADPAAVSLPGL